MGGRVVTAGTRVPAEVLFDNLADGLAGDEVAHSCPTSRKDDVLSVLAEASRRLGQQP